MQFLNFMDFAPNCLLCCVITLVFWNWILRTRVFIHVEFSHIAVTLIRERSVSVDINVVHFVIFHTRTWEVAFMLFFTSFTMMVALSSPVLESC